MGQLGQGLDPGQKGWGRGDGLLRGSQVKDLVGRPQGTVPVGTKARHGLDRGSGSAGSPPPSRPGVPDIVCWARCPDQGHPRSRSARTPPWSPTPRLSPTDPWDPCPGLTSSSTSTLDWSLCTSSLTSLSAPGEGSCGVREACSPCAPHPGPASRAPCRGSRCGAWPWGPSSAPAPVV